jgi:EAL domain-containing protein (putative c-di-GMP-specific phosphodiesterase class I)
MRPTGVQALIRWNSPARGVVEPEDFIPLLEETGLICEIGRWVCLDAETLEDPKRQSKTNEHICGEPA